MDNYNYLSHADFLDAEEYESYNKKLCFHAYNSLKECATTNKYRCPDELYAYEQWCPPQFQAIKAQEKYFYDLEKDTFTEDFLKSVNRGRQAMYSESLNNNPY